MVSPLSLTIFTFLNPLSYLMAAQSFPNLFRFEIKTKNHCRNNLCIMKWLPLHRKYKKAGGKIRAPEFLTQLQTVQGCSLVVLLTGWPTCEMSPAAPVEGICNPLKKSRESPAHPINYPFCLPEYFDHWTVIFLCAITALLFSDAVALAITHTIFLRGLISAWHLLWWPWKVIW